MLKIPFSYQADVILKGKRKNQIITIYDYFFFEPEKLEQKPECIAICKNYFRHIHTEMRTNKEISYFDVNNQLFKSLNFKDFYNSNDHKSGTMNINDWNFFVEEFLKDINKKNDIIQFNNGHYNELPKFPMQNISFIKETFIDTVSLARKSLYAEHEHFLNAQKNILSDNRKEMKQLAIKKLKEYNVSVYNDELFYNAKNDIGYFYEHQKDYKDSQDLNVIFKYPTSLIIPYFHENIMKQLCKDHNNNCFYSVEIFNQKKCEELYNENIIEKTCQNIFHIINGILNFITDEKDFQRKPCLSFLKQFFSNIDIANINEDESIMITEQLEHNLKSEIEDFNNEQLKKTNIIYEIIKRVDSLIKYIHVVKNIQTQKNNFTIKI